MEKGIDVTLLTEIYKVEILTILEDNLSETMFK